MNNLKLLAFDLDGTLAISKTSITPKMANLLAQLLKNYKIAVISGADLPQFEKQILAALNVEHPNLNNLLLLPTCGSKFYYFENNVLTKLYAEVMSDDECNKIINAFKTAIEALNLKPEQTYGEQIENRGGTQITFSALGQNTPIEVKSTWDPDMKIRQKIKDFIDPILPEFSVKIAGLSSIDVTRNGIDKAYGMNKLLKYTNFNKDEILFFGDKLMEGGNDHPVLSTEVNCKQVENEFETERILEEILNDKFEL